jgi:hypothetical protein
MSDLEDSKITWVICPDCGAKIGVALSIGKVDNRINVRNVEVEDSSHQNETEKFLTESGVDISLIEIEEDEETIIIMPKRFLGDLWGSINDAIRNVGGGWVREGRQSRWEIKKELLKK